MRRDRVGEFEELTLLAILAIGGPICAVPVQQLMEERAARSVSIGAVCAAFGRLESKGFLRSTFGEATPQRGGKRKRLYEVTQAGIRQLRELSQVREQIWKTIEERRS